jgi:hypothetical protein
MGKHNIGRIFRKGESLDTCPVIVERFESYLWDAAISLNATTIAEENSKQLTLDDIV